MPFLALCFLPLSPRHHIPTATLLAQGTALPNQTTQVTPLIRQGHRGLGLGCCRPCLMAPEPSTAPEPWARCRSHPGFIGAQRGEGGLCEGRAPLPAPRLETGVLALSSSLSAGSRGRDLGPGPQWGLALISSEGSIFRSPHPAFLGVVWWPEQDFALPLLSCTCGLGSSPAHACVSPECWTLCSTNEEEEREKRWTDLRSIKAFSLP